MNLSWNPWANDKKLLELYRRRCRQEVEEMTCAGQAAKILQKLVSPGERLLDAGCGGGYYYWSFLNRNISIDYYGLDYTPQMIELARTEMPKRTCLEARNFRIGAIEDLDEMFDTILCFNVLTSEPHYGRPLERMLSCAQKRLLLRDSLGERLKIDFRPDPYIDEDKRNMKVYFNTYPLTEVVSFIEGNGFKVTIIFDERTKDEVEIVCDVPHYWRILLAERLTNLK